jgi:hypothetical protein
MSASVVSDDLPAATPPGSLSSATEIKQITIDLCDRPGAGALSFAQIGFPNERFSTNPRARAMRPG